MAGIVLDPVADSRLAQHLQVIAGALADALRLQQFVLLLKETYLLFMFRFVVQ